jgi:hypothetical protein
MRNNKIKGNIFKSRHMIGNMRCDPIPEFVWSNVVMASVPLGRDRDSERKKVYVTWDIR